MRLTLVLFLLVWNCEGLAARSFTGLPVAELTAFDDVMLELMDQWEVPGAALAVVHKGRLVLAHGYGIARKDEPVQPDSMFRIASLSKPVTAAAMLKLQEQGRVKLDGQALMYLLGLPGLEFNKTDLRWWDVTLRHLLQHRGGTPSNGSDDPMRDRRSSCHSIVKKQINQPLNYDPGEKYLYSNFGYCVLGMVIQTVTEQSYEEYVRENLLQPLDIKHMRLGRKGKAVQGDREVEYFAQEGKDAYRLNIESWSSAGGWVASAIDLAKLFAALDGFPSRKDILKPESIEQMVSKPDSHSKNDNRWYGLGMSVRQLIKGQNWWHMGSFPGTRSIVVRAHDDTLWVALFNGRHKNKKSMGKDIDSSLWAARNLISFWPGHNLFDTY